MRIILLFILTLSVIAPGLAFGLDFEIADVIEVGPIHSGGMLRLAQWSPDGQFVAYFQGQELLVCDTLGTSHIVASLEWVPVGFHWVGNEEIAVCQKLIVSKREYRMKITIVDAATGIVTTLEDCGHRVMDPDRHNYRRIGDIGESFEGNPFYFVQENGHKWIEMVPRRNSDRNAEDNHVLRRGTDGVYMINTNLRDSTRISEDPYSSPIVAPIRVSRDTSHMMVDGRIVRLADDKVILLDTLSAVRIVAGCADGGRFWSYSMNPEYPEVTFLLICSDSGEEETIRIGLFDYNTYQLSILDEMINLPSCERPEFSPNGRDILVISQQQLYIVKRMIQ